MFSERLIALLKELNYLPLGSAKWRSFDISHVPPRSEDEKKRIRQYIVNHVGNACGVYVYTDNLGNVLYVGKAKPLKARLQSHYRESFEPVSGDRSGKWHQFFSSHQGTLKVHWLDIDEKDEMTRRIIEIVLTSELNPKFSPNGDRF